MLMLLTKTRRPPLVRAGLAALCALMTLSVTAASPDAKLLSGEVDSLLAYARAHHPELAAMRYEARAAAARVDAADALPDPMLRTELSNFTNSGSDAGANLLPARVGAARYTISQELPWPGKRQLRKDVATAGLGEAEQRARALWSDLARSIRQTHARHYTVLQSTAYARDNLDLLERLEQIAQIRYANGIAAQQDVIRAQTERSMVLAEIIGLESEASQLEARMRALLAADHDQVIAPPRMLTLPASLAALELRVLQAQVTERNPMLAIERARIDGAENARALVDRNRYPDFSIALAPMQMRNRVNSWDLMLEMNIPLQQSRRRSEEREATLMADAARSRHAAVLNAARAELAESWAGVQAAKRQDEIVNTRLLPQAELTLQAALAAYENGKVDFATVLEAQRQVRRAREDGVKARAEQLMRWADIVRLTGEES
jgi:cobalt-zinc-cadmium efflux system outer membrane protein